MRLTGNFSDVLVVESLALGIDRFKSFIGEEFDTKVQIVENGVKYIVDVKDGQKTGFFLDQKYNRAANVHKRLRQIEYRTQSPDHPFLWTRDEESLYLKLYIFEVCDEM